jgi:hypothetical protein
MNRSSARFFGLLCALAFTACQATPAEKIEPRADSLPKMKSTNDCPEPAVLADRTGWELASGSYKAERAGEDIIVRANGMNPTPNFEVQFVREKDGTLALYRKRPGGMQMQVMVGFNVCAKIKKASATDTMTLRDATGVQKVKVEAAAGK